MVVRLHWLCTMRTIPIPEPKHLTQKVAVVTCSDKGSLDVFWHEETQQLVMYAKDEFGKMSNGWFIQPDGNIIVSLAEFLPCKHSEIAINRAVVFPDQEMVSGVCAYKQLTEMYDCVWSEFASKKMVLKIDILYPTK